MKIGLYVIGDEILSGKRQDKHVSQVTTLLSERGLQLSWIKFLGDDLEQLITEFKASFDSQDLVFSCGGIGATPDDLTRLAVAKALNTSLSIHPKGLSILKSIEYTFKGGLTEQRKRMVEFPTHSQLIPNPINQIPGFSINNHYFVPGFPKMAEPMIKWVLENDFAKLPNDDYQEWSLILNNVPESEIIDLMQDIEQQYPVKVFSLPRFIKNGYQIELGLKGQKPDIENAKNRLLKALSQRQYSFQI